jgi:hypothetical protein
MNRFEQAWFWADLRKDAGERIDSTGERIQRPRGRSPPANRGNPPFGESAKKWAPGGCVFGFMAGKGGRVWWGGIARDSLSALHPQAGQSFWSLFVRSGGDGIICRVIRAVRPFTLGVCPKEVEL